MNINIWLFGGQLFSEIHRVGLGNIRVLVRLKVSLCGIPVFRKSQCRPRVAPLTEYNQSQVQLTGAPIYWKPAMSFGFNHLASGPSIWLLDLVIWPLDLVIWQSKNVYSVLER